MSSRRLCPSCQQAVRAKFCSHCGEKLIEPEDLAVKRFFAHGFATLTHADGKVFGTLRSLLFRPGELTSAYLTGRRKVFIGPVPFFLICNLLYFLLRPALGWDTLSSTLNSNLKLSAFTTTAQTLVAAKLAAGSTTLESYRPVFDRAAILNGKSFLLLLVPLYAVPLAVLFHRRGRPLVTHVVFALHFCAFFLLTLMVALASANFVSALAKRSGHSLTPFQLDYGTMPFIVVATTYYFYQATRRVYDTVGWSLAFRTAFLVMLLPAVLTGYRFALFLVTLWTT